LLIEYEGIKVTHDDVDVLSDFNLEVDKGEKVLIYGKSGMGKSTILKLLLGFAHPDSGTIFFEDKELDKKSVWEVRKRVAYVSQDLDIAEGKVRDFVDGVLNLKANSQLEDYEGRIGEVLELLELEESILGKQMTDISGGEKQRVALMVAILLQRDIYLLDEVTSAVDLEMKRKVVEYFNSLEDATVLSVSHDVNWLESKNMKVVRLGVG
jgi:putative ABC transport system ATP-binding protein